MFSLRNRGSCVSIETRHNRQTGRIRAQKPTPSFATPRKSNSAMNEHQLGTGTVPHRLRPECPARSGVRRSRADRRSASVTRAFDCPFVLIGRDPRSDLVLDDAQISRRHVFVQAVAGRILVVDLQSRTKVFWEGEEDVPDHGDSLDPDRFIQVGPYRIRRVGGDPSQDQEGELTDPSSPSDQERTGAGTVPRAALELPIRMGEGPSLWPLDEQVVLVGRSAECQLVLTDESVSRFHAALVPTPSGVWVVDLLAREGVHVNGERVRWAWLADGDTFRMGSFTFILRYETPPDQITRRDVPLEAGASVAEQPGTELAVRVREYRTMTRQALTVRPGGRSPASIEGRQAFPTRSSPPRSFRPVAVAGIRRFLSAPNPMAMWQQQMQLMESFHNDMILMVQMFVAMHREHLASVRHELDMVQQLTGELSDSPGQAGSTMPSPTERRNAPLVSIGRPENATACSLRGQTISEIRSPFPKGPRERQLIDRNRRSWPTSWPAVGYPSAEPRSANGSGRLGALRGRVLRAKSRSTRSSPNASRNSSASGKDIGKGSSVYSILDVYARIRGTLYRLSVARREANSGANHPSRLSRPLIRPLIILAMTSSRSLRATATASLMSRAGERSPAEEHIPAPSRARS